MDGDALRGGRYVTTKLLGEGAQGTTFEAVDKRDGRLVCVKRFSVRGASSWKDVELAEREARVLAALSHPLLPKYIEHFEEDGRLYLVMEKIEGETAQAIAKRGAWSERDVLRFLDDARDVLAYLHGRSPPIVHRDVKPSNFIRRPDGRYVLVDFGSVRDRLRPEGGSTVVGTFGYMAPEQFQGRALPASDVYAAGAAALRLLTGLEPEALPHVGLAIDVRRAVGTSAGEETIGALEAMLVPDPDRRVTAIPVVVPAKRRVRQEREARAERAARRGRGASKKPVTRPKKRGAWPLFPRVVVSLSFFVVQIVLVAVLKVAVPLVLLLLSILFGPALRRAAGRVSQAGNVAVGALWRVMSRANGGGEKSTDDPRIRVEGVPEEVRARVVSDEAAALDDEAEAPSSRRAGRV